MSVDANISDLFFNTDLAVAEVRDERGDFVKYDDARMREEARMFLACLARLNVPVPTPDELLTDFFNRV
jgi:hypothetical protein